MSDPPRADVDPGAVDALLEESRELHRDATVVPGQAPDDLVEMRRDRRAAPGVGADPPGRSPVRTGLTFGGGVLAAASIQPVEMQHAAILHFILGQYLVPDAFSPLAGPRPLSDYHG